MADIAKEWSTLESIIDSFSVSPKHLISKRIDESLFSNTSIALQQKGFGSAVKTYTISMLKKYYVEYAVPSFWSHFSDFEDNNELATEEFEELIIHHLFCAVDELASCFIVFSDAIKVLEKVVNENLLEKFQISLHASLWQQPNHEKLSKKLSFILQKYFSIMFNKYCMDNHEEDEKMEDGLQSLDNFQKLCQQLHLIGLTSLSIDVGMKVIFSLTKEQIENLCKGEFTERKLSIVLSWFSENVVPWLSSFFSTSLKGNNIEDSFQIWKTRLEFFIFHTFTNIRIEELFNIIIEYPDSQPALTDLKECLIKTGLHNELINSLRNAFQKRLLHAGANTSDIITQYINTIKVLNYLDPTGVSLDIISKDVNKYLKQRQDTVKCIIMGLTDQESDLYEELINQETNEEEEEDWTPAPLYANPSCEGKKEVDVIKKLISIYGNNDVFVNEYRTILCQRLLNNLDYETEHESKMLELLKIRFGEKAMQTCEIMIKDISDSKRTNTNIHTKIDLSITRDLCKNNHQNITIEEDGPIIDTTIISAIYWPKLQDVEYDVKFHPVIQSLMDAYEKEFRILKAPRRLICQSTLGNIQLEVELNGQTIDIDTSPIHASIILYFADQGIDYQIWKVLICGIGERKLSELSSLMNLDSKVLFKFVMYWVTKGVIQIIEENDEDVIFKVSETLNEMSNVDIIEEEMDDKKQDDNGMAIYEPLIIGMLTNLGSASLDKIHNMLKMFACDPFPAYDKSIVELGTYLNQMVMEGKLEFDGEYKKK